MLVGQLPDEHYRVVRAALRRREIDQREQACMRFTRQLPVPNGSRSSNRFRVAGGVSAADAVSFAAAAVNEACQRTGGVADCRRSAVGLRAARATHLLPAAIDLKPQRLMASTVVRCVRLAQLTRERHVAAKIAPGDHGTTHGGNLLAACRAALCFVEGNLGSGGLSIVSPRRRTLRAAPPGAGEPAS